MIESHNIWKTPSHWETDFRLFLTSMFNSKSNSPFMGGSHQLLSRVSNTLGFLLIYLLLHIDFTRVCGRKRLRHVSGSERLFIVLSFEGQFQIFNRVWVMCGSWNMAIKELQLPVIFVLTADPGAAARAHMQTARQTGKTHSRTQSQHDSLGIFSQIGPLKGKRPA